MLQNTAILLILACLYQHNSISHCLACEEPDNVFGKLCAQHLECRLILFMKMYPYFASASC